jgi:hypothetical protein
LVVGQFAVAALYERRNLLNQNAAVIDRRYSKLTHYLPVAQPQDGDSQAVGLA